MTLGFEEAADDFQGEGGADPHAVGDDQFFADVGAAVFVFGRLKGLAAFSFDFGDQVLGLDVLHPKSRMVFIFAACRFM